MVSHNHENFRPSTRSTNGSDTIQHQAPLSWIKAVEISFNAVRVRFHRSLIAATGIVLAITFLMATLTRGATVQNMAMGISTDIESKRKSAEMSKLLKRVEASLNNGLKIQSVADELENGNYARAQSALSELIRTKPDLAQNENIKEIERLLPLALTTLIEVKKLEKVLRTMSRMGEGLRQDQQERAESRARERWLIGLALLVALVGITNAMLMAVSERYREIGTMKCLGAPDGFIVKLFLIESSMQGFLGTLLGIALGLLLSFGKLYYDYGSPFWRFLPSADLGAMIIYSMAVGTGLAVIGAILPALKAAKMEPVAAMRMDQ